MANEEAVEPVVQQQEEVPEGFIRVEPNNEKMVVLLRQELEEANHQNRILRIALGEAHEAAKSLRAEIDAIALQVAANEEGKKKQSASRNGSTNTEGNGNGKARK